MTLDEVKGLGERARRAVRGAPSIEELERVRVEYLGRKGSLTSILRALGELPPDERPKVGALANELRTELETSIAARKDELSRAAVAERVAAECIDITLPGKRYPLGHKHLITRIIEEVTGIFIGLGYKVAEGPEVELDYYNFEALNTPPDHPARSLQDTFYVTRGADRPQPDDVLLRTHTSPVQIRYMKEHEPPVYIIAPGKAYRHDVADPTHAPMFHQIEGLAVDKSITMGDLKGTLEAFAKGMFGEDRRVRLRPHFFPFTEPSAEVDVSCFICGGIGCRVCGNGWIEILGAGMVDPNVLEEVGYDPEEVSGFAFGMGVERIAMLKYGVSDMRLFFENDLRLLKQF